MPSHPSSIFDWLPVLNTQLPHEWLEYLPDVLYEQRYVSMFPFQWHLLLNYVSFASSIIATLVCMYHGHWLMKEKPLTSWGLKQFFAYLIFHSVFYIVELLVSDMCMRYTAMAYHHLVALGIFSLFFFEPGAVCVFSIIPFLFHCNFWVFYNADSQFQLFLYNLSLFIVGLGSLVLHATTQGRRCSWRIPMLCVIEVAVNYYNYCWDFFGRYCPETNSLFKDRRLGLVILISILTCACIIVTIMVAKSVGIKSSKKSVLPKRLKTQVALLKEE